MPKLGAAWSRILRQGRKVSWENDTARAAARVCHARYRVLRCSRKCWRYRRVDRCIASRSTWLAGTNRTSVDSSSAADTSPPTLRADRRSCPVHRAAGSPHYAVSSGVLHRRTCPAPARQPGNRFGATPENRAAGADGWRVNMRLARSRGRRHDILNGSQAFCPIPEKTGSAKRSSRSRSSCLRCLMLELPPPGASRLKPDERSGSRARTHSPES